MFPGFVRLAGNPRINLQLEAKDTDFRGFSEGRPRLWPVACNPGFWSGGIEARIGLRMMPTFPRSSLSFRTAGFPQYGWKAGISGGTFPKRQSA
jgi:hypothetical protein